LNTVKMALRAAIAAMAFLAAGSTIAAAQTYPTRPVRFIVPTPPGGGTDTLARIAGSKASEILGAPVVIDNRGGAGGNIAAKVVADSATDGYTLLLGNLANVISMSLYRKLDYDLLRDFVPVTELASVPFILTVNPSVPAQSVKELIALAKAKPGYLSYASSGNGQPSHLAMELLKSMAGVDITHIPYKGAGPAAVDVISGQVQMYFFALPAGLPHVRGGKLRGLAVGSATRAAAAPDFPTIAESGLPGFEAMTWYGVLVPAGTPSVAVNKLHSAFSASVNAPDIRKRLVDQGFDIIGNTPAEFRAYIQTELVKWDRIVKLSGSRVD
jgi:tripartite-type tricarboxylate transporter receptor subunit TctC